MIVVGEVVQLAGKLDWFVSNTAQDHEDFPSRNKSCLWVCSAMNAMNCSRYALTHLETLESESIHILREVAAECRNPALFFSGGKDSLVLLRLAEKAFRPARFPFPLMHIDTEHNFPEVIEFRDRRAAELGERLIVRSVGDSIAQGRVC